MPTTAWSNTVSEPTALPDRTLVTYVAVVVNEYFDRAAGDLLTPGHLASVVVDDERAIREWRGHRGGIVRIPAID